ncbi:MAG: acyl-CoA dehydrogenase family protein, partial [Gammaproteobacteria bacterium]
MSVLLEQIESLKFQLESVGELEKILDSETFGHVDSEMIDMMFDQSIRFAEEKLIPLAESGDVEGCKLENGCVMLPAGTREVYQEWCELGFPALGLPLDNDGLGFPNVVQCAVQEILDGSNQAFGMMSINVRCAIKALLANAPEALVERWLPGLISGDNSFTIVISEPQAGSDVGRIRTSATPTDGDKWSITGSKIWISFGDHDATDQIVHLVLARVPSEEIGTRALGLFAIPKFKDDILDEEHRNGVNVSRLEHKMGLHASPTCVLELENAEGYLIGETGKGLQALFVMMNGMRLAVGIQGAATANMATLHAIAYAKERPQGGRPDQPPVMITEHADVKRMLLEMTAQSEMIRALALRTAAYLDLAEITGDSDILALGELLLPITKTVGAETGFAVASQGIQVLGGYGYTNDYPLERMARDIRVASIYEGTSGIQALDFLKRNVLGDDAALLNRLLEIVRNDIESTLDENPLKYGLTNAINRLESALASLQSMAAADKKSVDGGAYHFMNLTGL